MTIKFDQRGISDFWVCEIAAYASRLLIEGEDVATINLEVAMRADLARMASRPPILRLL